MEFGIGTGVTQRNYRNGTSGKNRIGDDESASCSSKPFNRKCVKYELVRSAVKAKAGLIFTPKGIVGTVSVNPVVSRKKRRNIGVAVSFQTLKWYLPKRQIDVFLDQSLSPL